MNEFFEFTLCHPNGCTYRFSLKSALISKLFASNHVGVLIVFAFCVNHGDHHRCSSIQTPREWMAIFYQLCTLGMKNPWFFYNFNEEALFYLVSDRIVQVQRWTWPRWHCYLSKMGNLSNDTRQVQIRSIDMDEQNIPLRFCARIHGCQFNACQWSTKVYLCSHQQHAEIS